MTRDEKYYVFLYVDGRVLFTYGPYSCPWHAASKVTFLLSKGHKETEALICRNIPFHTEVSTRVVIDEE